MADIDAMIRDAAARYNLDHDIFRRQLIAESGLNPSIVNQRSGAAGIAQFMPATARGMGIDPMDPSQAIPAAALYMRQNLNRFGGDYDHALAAYNWGPGNVSSKGLDNMPQETWNYIRKIKGGVGDGGPVMLASASAPGGGTPPALPAAPDQPGPPQDDPAPPPMIQPAVSLADMFKAAAKRGQGFA